MAVVRLALILFLLPFEFALLFGIELALFFLLALTLVLFAFVAHCQSPCIEVVVS